MVFATRTELTDKVKQSVLQYTGKGAQCDPRRCSGQRVVLRCPATMTSTPGQKASWKGDSLEGFTCRRKRGETAKTFAVRKNKQLEKFAGQKMCKFRAVGLKQKDSTWKLQEFDGRSFIPHDEDCLCYGNANGRVLVNLMQPAISANPHMTAKQRDKALMSAGVPLNRAMFPKSSSTMYRAQRAVRDMELRYYNVYWSRLEAFVKDLQRLNNTGNRRTPWHTRVYRESNGQHFRRFFVGIGPGLQICKHAALDHYALDATFTKHDVVHGMQYHILCGRSGANHRIPLAISLEQTESCETYEFFARKCKQWGLGAVLQVEPGKFARRCCVVSDGDKGTSKFAPAFAQPGSGKTAPFRSRCAKHLADSCRNSLRRMKIKNKQVNCGFHDEQMYNIAAAA